MTQNQLGESWSGYINVKVNFSTKKITKDKGGHYMIK